MFWNRSVAGMPPPPQRRRWWRFLGRHLPGFSVLLMTALLATIVLWPYVVITVPSGRVGVLWKRFNGFDLYCWCFVGRGTILEPRELREEGLHIIWPWDKLFLYDLRLQSTSQIYNAISKDGVSVTAQINIRYQLLHNSVAVLHKFIGPAYMMTVVNPEIGSQAREVISQYTAQEVYTSREPIQDKIRQTSQKSLGTNLNKLVQPEAMEQPDPKHYNDFLQDAIQILDTLVLSIELPPEIVGAINRQTQEFYAIQEFKFRVEREAEESKRKQIEADGIAAFQRTVSQGISESYLRWRGIEATLELARSPNAKIVIDVNPKDGLPIILGNVDTPAGSGITPAPGPGGATVPPSRVPAAPTDKAPGGTSPDGGSNGAPAPKGTSGDNSSAKDKFSEDAPTAPASSLNLPDFGSVLSKISGALHPTDASSGSGEKPKQ
jgi:prohibitin 2